MFLGLDNFTSGVQITRRPKFYCSSCFGSDCDQASHHLAKCKTDFSCFSSLAKEENGETTEKKGCFMQSNHHFSCNKERHNIVVACCKTHLCNMNVTLSFPKTKPASMFCIFKSSYEGLVLIGCSICNLSCSIHLSTLHLVVHKASVTGMCLHFSRFTASFLTFSHEFQFKL